MRSPLSAIECTPAHMVGVAKCNRGVALKANPLLLFY